MTRLFLITLLVLSSGPAYAEWVAIGNSEGTGGYTVYVDPATIRRKGDLVKMWSLFDFKTRQTDLGTSYLSSKSQGQFDCTEERHRAFAITWFSGNMGNGTAVGNNSEEGTWQSVAPESVAKLLWKAACAKQ